MPLFQAPGAHGVRALPYIDGVLHEVADGGGVGRENFHAGGEVGEGVENGVVGEVGVAGSTGDGVAEFGWVRGGKANHGEVVGKIFLRDVDADSGVGIEEVVVVAPKGGDSGKGGVGVATTGGHGVERSTGFQPVLG